MNKKFLLIDGNSVLFRGFYATCYGKIMKTSFGVYTNAVYAFCNMIEKAFELIKPDYCLVAFDKGKHTFRHEIAPDYKGGRKQTPEELIPQFALVREMLTASNIKWLELDDIEADDIIGSMAKRVDFETCIFSSDHDLLQLIDDTTSVYMMKKGMTDIVKFDEKQLFDELQLKPYQIIEYKGLAGDSSDNIHGVEGVGDKTAVKLLNDYESIDGIYDHIEDIKGKLKEKLINGKDSAYISKKLATIKTDVPLNYDLNDFEFKLDNNSRNEFFKKYEMKSLIKNVYKGDIDLKEVDIETTTISKEILNNPFIFFLSNEFSYYQKEIRGLCFINDRGIEYITYENLLNDKQALEFLKSNSKKYVYDYKAIKHAAFDNGFEINNCEDVLLMCYLVNNYNNEIDEILKDYGYYVDISIKDIYGTDKKRIEIDHKKEISFVYDICKAFYNIIPIVEKQLNEKDLLSLYKDVELPLSNVLYDMENEGIICDKNELQNIANKTLNKMNILEQDIYSYVGEFNISSPKQLSEVLYDKLDLPNLKKGSTNAEVLSKLSSYHPIIGKILEYRKYSKLYSSYAEGLQRFIDHSSKIHTVFSQTIVQTGRLSSYDPNLQNISVRDEEGKEIRSTFKPLPNSVLISCDYSQIELRVLAHLANEEKMIDAFNNGIDIHTKTAMDVFGLNENEVDSNVRRKAKAVNFGVVYGISDFGLANQASLSFAEAKKFIDDYFKTYPNIKLYLDEQVNFCMKNGYVKTLLNRRRYIKEINDKNYMIKEFGKRAAMNSTVQGSAADIIKLAMIDISKKIHDNNLKSRLVLQVHDELIFNVINDEIDIMQRLINESMSKAYKLKVKLESSLAIGKNWLEAK